MRNYKWCLVVLFVFFFCDHVLSQNLVCATEGAKLITWDRNAFECEGPNDKKATIFVALKEGYFTSYTAKHKFSGEGDFVLPELKKIPVDPFPGFFFIQEEVVISREKGAFEVGTYKSSNHLSSDRKYTYGTWDGSDGWVEALMTSYGSETLNKYGVLKKEETFFSDGKNGFKLKLNIKKFSTKYVIEEAYMSSEVDCVISIEDSYGAVFFSKEMHIVGNDYPRFLASRTSNFYIEEFFNGNSYGNLWKDIISQIYLEFFSLPELAEALKKQTSMEVAENVVAEDIVIVRKDSLGLKKSEWLHAVVTIEGTLGHGSGCVVSNDGLIITNYHVVHGAGDSLFVTFYNGEKQSAKLLRFDAASDLALLKVESKELFFVTPPTIANSKVGDKVWVIGTPADKALGQTITGGILSGMRDSEGIVYLQTDAHVNPGNSGGGLFDKSGKLIGIVSSKAMGLAVEGVGFAISSSLIYEKLEIKIKD